MAKRGPKPKPKVEREVNKIAQAMSRMRNEKLSPERRQEIARNAAETRWKRWKQKKRKRKPPV